MKLQYKILAKRYEDTKKENKKIINENINLLKENIILRKENKQLLLLLEVKVNKTMEENTELENELYETIFELRDKIYKLEDENEELKDEIDFLKEKMELREQDIADNYKRIDISTQVGITDRDFI